ncbi:hypothetical protein D3C84_1211490 [compost metagenome]
MPANSSTTAKVRSTAQRREDYRRQIEDMWRAGLSLRQIARLLNTSQGVVRRKLKARVDTYTLGPMMPPRRG